MTQYELEDISSVSHMMFVRIRAGGTIMAGTKQKLAQALQCSTGDLQAAISEQTNPLREEADQEKGYHKQPSVMDAVARTEHHGAGGRGNGGSAERGGNIMQTTYGVQELAERWGLTTTTIRKMEQDGKLHRLPDMPGVKYPAEEVFQLENIGPAAKALTPWERKQMKEEIEGLKQQVKDLQERLLKAQAVLQGVSL